jgi:hypothetical protein
MDWKTMAMVLGRNRCMGLTIKNDLSRVSANKKMAKRKSGIVQKESQYADSWIVPR